MSVSSPELVQVHYQAGKVRNIEVVVVTVPDDNQFQVQMIDTFEGVSDVGEPFIGKGALRRASMFSESILSALESADITWE